MRDQILSGALKPGEQLPSQQVMAETYNTSLMTLRQALSSLESDGLIVIAAGRGTYVAERPVDVRVGNLSSFAGTMQAAGIELATEVLDVVRRTAEESSDAASALGFDGGMVCLVRRRSVDGVPFSLQRSYLTGALGEQVDFDKLVGESLYQSVEAVTGWVVGAAREAIRAVKPSKADAKLLDTRTTEPALLSVRTSFNQFDVPFLYDEAILVGDRCTIAADRTSDRLSISYGLANKSS